MNRAGIEARRLQHVPFGDKPDVSGNRYCIMCDELWPCSTRRSSQVVPCAYCGSVSGETPVGVVAFDPLTESTLRTAISAASDLTNPRLSEVDWGAVAAALSYMTGVPEPGGCPHPESAMTSTDDMIICTRCRGCWPNRVSGAEFALRLNFPHADDCGMWTGDPPRCTCPVTSGFQ